MKNIYEFTIIIQPKLKGGDILVVEHDGKNVTCVYCKDEAEKARRLEVLRSIRGR